MTDVSRSGYICMTGGIKNEPDIGANQIRTPGSGGDHNKPWNGQVDIAHYGGFCQSPASASSHWNEIAKRSCPNGAELREYEDVISCKNGMHKS